MLKPSFGLLSRITLFFRGMTLILWCRPVNQRLIHHHGEWRNVKKLVCSSMNSFGFLRVGLGGLGMNITEIFRLHTVMYIWYKSGKE